MKKQGIILALAMVLFLVGCTETSGDYTRTITPSASPVTPTHETQSLPALETPIAEPESAPQLANPVFKPAIQVPNKQPKPTPTPAVSPPVPVAPTPIYVPEPEPTQGCCKICSKGKACGDSCISRSYTCHKGPGCACDG